MRRYASRLCLGKRESVIEMNGACQAQQVPRSGLVLCPHALKQVLKKSFDPQTDYLFCLGDSTDRGEGIERYT
jgi:hypothetical protein